jgi:hypothetical protein
LLAVFKPIGHYSFMVLVLLLLFRENKAQRIENSIVERYSMSPPPPTVSYIDLCGEKLPPDMEGRGWGGGVMGRKPILWGYLNCFWSTKFPLLVLPHDSILCYASRSLVLLCHYRQPTGTL